MRTISGFTTRIRSISFAKNASSLAWAWPRDYAPLYVKYLDEQTQDIKIKVLDYITHDEETTNYGHSSYVPVPPLKKDFVFFRRDYEHSGYWLLNKKLNLVLAGGNLVSTGNHVFTTSLTIEENINQNRPMSDDWKSRNPLYRKWYKNQGYKPRNPEQIKKILAKNLEIPKSHLHVIDPLPGDTIKHADFVLLPISRTQVIVPEVRDEGIDTLLNDEEKHLGWQAKDYLNGIADFVASKDIEVIRLPMMPGTHGRRRLYDNFYHVTYFSPANSLLVNFNSEKKILMPSHDPDHYSEAYRSLNKNYENNWMKTLRGLGWEPILVDLQEAGNAGGLARCLTSIRPDVEPYLSCKR